ncbi:MAG: hypothetical protein ACK55Z_27415, partial [bacterium]
EQTVATRRVSVEFVRRHTAIAQRLHVQAQELLDRVALAVGEVTYEKGAAVSVKLHGQVIFAVLAAFELEKVEHVFVVDFDAAGAHLELQPVALLLGDLIEECLDAADHDAI